MGLFYSVFDQGSNNESPALPPMVHDPSSFVRGLKVVNQAKKNIDAYRSERVDAKKPINFTTFNVKTTMQVDMDLNPQSSTTFYKNRAHAIVNTICGAFHKNPFTIMALQEVCTQQKALYHALCDELGLRCHVTLTDHPQELNMMLIYHPNFNIDFSVSPDFRCQFVKNQWDFSHSSHLIVNGTECKDTKFLRLWDPSITQRIRRVLITGNGIPGDIALVYFHLPVFRDANIRAAVLSAAAKLPVEFNNAISVVMMGDTNYECKFLGPDNLVPTTFRALPGLETTHCHPKYSKVRPIIIESPTTIDQFPRPWMKGTHTGFLRPQNPPHITHAAIQRDGTYALGSLDVVYCDRECKPADDPFMMFNQERLTQNIAKFIVETYGSDHAPVSVQWTP